MGTRIESALFTSQSGIQAHGQSISVIGDNIANISTPGFKAQRAEFANLVAEGPSGGSSSARGSEGNGVKISNVRTIQSPGAIEQTGRALDAGINGQGFFVVGTTASPNYTRAGNFSVNSLGNLTTPSGSDVLGFAFVNGTRATTLSALNLLNFDTAATATSTMAIGGNVQSSEAIITAPANPTSFTELNTLSSYLAGVETIDSLGGQHGISIAFSKTAANTWTAQAYVDGGEVGGVAGTPTLVGTTTLTFDETGKIPEANKAAAQLVLTPAYSGGAAAGNIAVDLSNFTQFASVSTLKDVTQNGVTAGALKGFEIADNGDVVATLSNGNKSPIGSLAVAGFNNVDGLSKIGDNLYRETVKSGTAITGLAGVGSNGTIEGSALERSTVDLATEMSKIIVDQKGFQANSRIFTKVEELIDQAISMLR
ncbi:MAG: flagellar hook protein FlgE [bacterium]|nr:flagellar hook protein FlgE [bacterium]